MHPLLDMSLVFLSHKLNRINHARTGNALVKPLVFLVPMGGGNYIITYHQPIQRLVCPLVYKKLLLLVK